MKKKNVKKGLVVYLEDGIIDLPKKIVDGFIEEVTRNYFKSGEDKGIKYLNDSLAICSNVINGEYLFITLSKFD